MVMVMVGAFCFVAGLAVGAFVILMDDGGTTADFTQANGRWITKDDNGYYGGGCWKCSSCGYGYSFGAYFEADEFNYCPNCGTKMDIESHEDE